MAQHPAAKVPLSVLCVKKNFNCRSGDHVAAERNTQRPFQEMLLGMSGTIPVREDTNLGRAAGGGGKKNPVRLNRAYH